VARQRLLTAHSGSQPGRQFQRWRYSNPSDLTYQTVLGGHAQDAVFYLHAKFAPFQNATDLVFWGCFAFNGGGTFKLTVAGSDSYIDLTPLGEHEGDWEHIMIRVDNNTLRPVKAYMSAHNGGSWVDLNTLDKDPVTGPHQVYMSYHGHASYPTREDNLSNTYTQGILFEIGLANRCDAGLRINLGDQDRVALISAGFLGPLEPAEPVWLQLPWRWVRYYDFSAGQLTDVSNRVLGGLKNVPDMQAAEDAIADILIRKKVLGDEGNSAGPQAIKFKNNWFGSE
jgi:Vacuolar protein sorting-associated protein 62